MATHIFPPHYMRVSWVFPHFHPVLAGAAERFRRYAPQLGKRGLSIDVMTARDPSNLPDFELLEGGLPVRRFEVSMDPRTRDQQLYEQVANQLTADSGGGIVQTIKTERNLLPALRRIRVSGRHLVQVCTMVEPGLEDIHGLARLKRRISTFLTLRPYSAVVTSSRVMADWHRQFGVPEHKMHIISNGVYTIRFRPAEDASERAKCREALGVSKADFVVLVAGHLIPRKRPHLVVEAWRAVTAAHPSAVLLLAGSAKRPTVRSVEEEQGIASYQRSVFDSINAQGANVRWLGERSDMEVLYRAADVFAFPTEQEGFGNVILEAMASRLPVVCAEFRGFPKAEIGGVVALVQGDTVEAWAEALLKLAHEPVLAEHLGTNGCALVSRKFTLDLVISQFHQVYQGVLKKPISH